MTDVLGPIEHLPLGIGIERGAERKEERATGVFLSASRPGFVIVEIYSKRYIE